MAAQRPAAIGPAALRPAGWRPRLSHAASFRLVRAGSLILVLLVWEAAGRAANSALSFPPFSTVLAALGERLADPLFWVSLWTTLQSLLVGFALMIAVGLPLGLIAGRFETARLLIDPYLRFFLSVPTSPLVPVFIVIFGLGLTSRVATVFIFGISILIVNVASAVRSVSPRLIEMAESYGATPRQVLLRVVFPGSLPGIAAGLRLAAGRAVVGMVVAELIIVSVGLGKLIQRYSATFDAPDLFAIVIVVLLVGVVVVKAVGAVERHFAAWKAEA